MEITLWKYTVKCTVYGTWKYTVKNKIHGTWKLSGKYKVCWCQNKLTYLMVLVQIHTSLHFEHFISWKTTYIFCLIGLQTLISAVSPRGIHARYGGEKLRGKFFMDNFDLVLWNKLTYSISLYPLYTLKLLRRKYFSK